MRNANIFFRKSVLFTNEKITKPYQISPRRLRDLKADSFTLNRV